MSWTDDILDELAAETHWSYRPGGELAAEPLSLAVLALAGYGRADDARRTARRLTALQGADGSVGVMLHDSTPGWPTGLAVLAWAAAERVAQKASGAADKNADFQRPIARGAGWLLATGGDTSIHNPDVGHNSHLRGWPWAEGTHSWIEPTSLALLALKATGHGEHGRSREAVSLLFDRLLPEGGCNYGNTTVLGQVLRPNLAVSGLALAALAGEGDAGGRVAKTIGYLKATLNAQTTSVSLAYGVIGLAAHDAAPAEADVWLKAASRRTGREAAPYKRALLALAALGDDCPVFSQSSLSRVH